MGIERHEDCKDICLNVKDFHEILRKSSLQLLEICLTYAKYMHDEHLRQAGAELGQAQVRLDDIVIVVIEVVV